MSGRRQNHHKCHKLVVAHSHKVDLLLVFSNYISIFLGGSILLSMDCFFLVFGVEMIGFTPNPGVIMPYAPANVHNSGTTKNSTGL